MTEKMQAQDVVESMNGFDEIAVRKVFAVALEDLGALTLSRALVFTLLRREGMSDNDAHAACMEMTQKEIKSHFADPDQAADAFEGDLSESGKGEPAL